MLVNFKHSKEKTTIILRFGNLTLQALWRLVSYQNITLTTILLYMQFLGMGKQSPTFPEFSEARICPDVHQ